MAFWGKRFIFDSIPSERYSLIISAGDGEVSSTKASMNMELITETIFRRPIPYLLGVKTDKPLQLNASITTTEGEITIEDARLIQKWLFGHLTYKKLYVVQNDMPDYYFNCILLDPQIRRVGNIIRGFEFTIQCDSPFGGYGNTITDTITKLENAYDLVEISEELEKYTFTQTTQTMNIYNTSDNNDYTYPIIKVYMKNSFIIYSVGEETIEEYVFPGWFTIKNKTDGNRIFSFGKDFGNFTDEYKNVKFTEDESLFQSEILTINNDFQTIQSTASSYNRLYLMNSDKNFFRLLPKNNELEITGNYSKIEIIYNPVIRIS